MPIRSALPLILLLSLLGAAYAAWTWSDLLTTMRGDSAVYLLSARHFAFWRALDPIAADVARESQFPPMYPLLLAYAGAASSMHAANLLTVVLCVAGWLALFAWSTRQGLPTGHALLVVAIAAALPQALRLALNPQSEHLYLPLSVAVLLALDDHRRTGHPQAFAMAALAATAATLTRTIGIALFAPLVIHAIQRRDHRWMLVCAAALLPIVAWQLVHHPAQPYDAYIKSFYFGGGPDNAVDYLIGAPQRLLNNLAVNLTDAPVLHWPALAIAITLCIAAAWRALRMQSDGIYVAAYLAIVAVWPFPGETRRFLFAITPLLITQLAVVIAGSLRHRAASLAAPVLIAALLAPGLMHLASRYLQGLDESDSRLRSFPEWYEADQAQARARAETLALHIDGLRRIPQFVDENDCVINIYPILIEYFAGRHAVEPPPAQTDDESFWRGIRERRCGHIFVMTAIGGQFFEPMYPLNRVATALHVVDAEPPQALQGQAQPVTLLAEIRPPPGER